VLSVSVSVSVPVPVPVSVGDGDLSVDLDLDACRQLLLFVLVDEEDGCWGRVVVVGFDRRGG